MRIHREENEANVAEESDKTKEENKYHCKFCLKKFGSVTSLQNHMTNKHAELGKKCKHCSKIFFSKRGLTRHILLHEMVNQKQGQVSEQVHHPSQEVIVEQEEDVLLEVIGDLGLGSVVYAD